jgi:hypothetical protein
MDGGYDRGVIIRQRIDFGQRCGYHPVSDDQPQASCKKNSEKRPQCDFQTAFNVHRVAYLLEK